MDSAANVQISCKQHQAEVVLAIQFHCVQIAYEKDSAGSSTEDRGPASLWKNSRQLKVISKYIGNISRTTDMNERTIMSDRPTEIVMSMLCLCWSDEAKELITRRCPNG